MRGTKEFFLLLSLGILTSCHYQRLFYSHLDWLIIYQLDRYFDLRPEQEKALEPQIEGTIVWFKKQRLPLLVKQVEENLAAADARKFSPTANDAWIQSFEENRRLLVERIEPKATELLLSLDDQQIEHLQKKLKKANQALDELVQSSEEDFQDQLEDYAESSLERVQYLFGRLRPEQKQMFYRSLALNRLQLGRQLIYRQSLQKEWLNVLQRRDAQAIQNALISGAPSQELQAEVQIFQTHARAGWQAFWKALEPTLDEKQWRHCQKTLRELLKELGRFELS